MAKFVCAAKRFAGPVRALIQAMQNFYQPNGIDFVDAAGFRIIADRRRIAGDGEDVADTADGPSAKQHGLQADDVEIARGEVRHGFDAAGLQSAPRQSARPCPRGPSRRC